MNTSESQRAGGVTTMHAQVGDWLVLPEGPGHPHPRRGVIVTLLHRDGSPPYRVRWLDQAHETVIFPPPDTDVRHGRPSCRSTVREGVGGTACWGRRALPRSSR